MTTKFFFKVKVSRRECGIFAKSATHRLDTHAYPPSARAVPTELIAAAHALDIHAWNQWSPSQSYSLHTHSHTCILRSTTHCYTVDGITRGHMCALCTHDEINRPLLRSRWDHAGHMCIVLPISHCVAHGPIFPCAMAAVYPVACFVRHIVSQSSLFARPEEVCEVVPWMWQTDHWVTPDVSTHTPASTHHLSPALFVHIL